MDMTALQRRVAVAFVSAAAVAAIPAGLVPTAHAADGWGSIAYSKQADSKGNPVGAGVVNAPSKDAAESAAISNCGQSDCAVLIDFQDCAAVAKVTTSDGGSLYAQHASTLEAAVDAALSKAGTGATIDMQGCNKGYS